MGSILIVAFLLVIELVVGLVLLGTWIAEGRQRDEELGRIEGILRRHPGLFENEPAAADRS